MVLIGSVLKRDIMGSEIYNYSVYCQSRGAVPEWLIAKDEEEHQKRLREIEERFAKIDKGFEWMATTLEINNEEKRRVAYRKNPAYDPSNPTQPRFFMRDNIDGVNLDILTDHLDGHRLD